MLKIATTILGFFVFEYVSKGYVIFHTYLKKLFIKKTIKSYKSVDIYLSI